MSDITISYKGNDIATMDASGTKTLLTEGKYCEDDITLSYTKPSGGGITADDIASSSISGAITITGDTINGGAFWGNENITSVTGANVTSVGESSLRSLGTCAISLPKLTTIGTSAFNYTVSDFYFPEVTTLSNTAFSYAGTTGKYLALPALTGSLGELFRNNRHTILDLGYVTSLGTRCLYQGYNKTVLILRASSVVSASATNAITTINSGTTVYVPATLVSSYSSQTNWAATGCTFASLEGSIYEREDWAA